MVLMRSIVFPIQSPMTVSRPDACELAMVQAPVSADLNLTPDVHTQGIGELEGVEECVGYYSRSLIRCFGFEESGII